ncbi:ABC transporter ATP-binding protein [Pseudactinotalea sp. Z1732]|uniref:ABC transporter ATP-binding protein n=1 Tax=Pseudactinotalea sp. Z1732 TaxID=3413026 RepID=UPI003C7AC095
MSDKPRPESSPVPDRTEEDVTAARDQILDEREDLVEHEEAREKAGPSSGAVIAAKALADVAPEPGVAKPDPILVATGMTRHFGGLRAVDVDHLEVQRGTITALIGPNGAGKSTFFNLVSGFDRPSAGSWTFNGQSLRGLPAYKIARRGMVRTFQLTKALMRLTTLENVMLGATGQRGENILAAQLPFLWRSQERQIEARADELLERFRLSHMRDEFAGTMSGGQRKLLEMARALMVDPDLIMLDEPMAGVNPALTQSLLGHIQNLRDEGKTIVLVEHDMDVIMSISDWIICFAQGAVIAEGRPADISTNPAVIEAYLGTRAEPAESGGQEER